MKINKNFLATLIFFILCINVAVFYFQIINRKNLEVSFLNIGQGDSILIESPNGQNILIDGGPDRKVIEELGKILPWWDRTIDLIILTHPHDDHVTGLNYVVAMYNVKNVLYEKINVKSADYNNFVQLIEKDDINIIPLTIDNIKLGENCDLNILHMFDILNDNSLNNRSIVTKLDCLGSKFLFTGDIEHEAEEHLVANNTDIKCDVLKVAHHGSKTSSIDEFLDKTLPSIAVIQVGKDNKFGHPNEIVLNRLNKRNIKILRNDINGTINFFKKQDNKLIYNYEK